MYNELRQKDIDALDREKTDAIERKKLMALGNITSWIFSMI